jgi:queuine/archaeosine tRNA-ribosyltransferase
LSTVHNIRYMQLLIKGIRTMISEGPFCGSTSVDDVLNIALREQ